jgi:SAM-dependent methyltransferase
MGIRLPRTKPRHWLLSAAYRLHRLLPLSRARKLDFYLDLEWIAARLASETSFEVYDRPAHPVRADGFRFKYVESQHRVLDLGCGTGVLTHMLAGHAAEVVGIDHDPAMIAQARRDYPQLSFECGDARDYLRQAPKFDLLFLSHVLEHLDDPEAFLRQFAGFFDLIFIEVPDFDASYLNRMRADRGRQLIYGDSDHVAEFDRDELKALIRSAGLRIRDENYAFGVMQFWCEAADA